ncbi:MAG: hypothetical protein U9P72_04735 [Campylobacterota bacterium]|nr:hypothetical protein [Campylobacterota bacterium]
MSVKSELLDEIETIITPEKKLDFLYLLYTLIVLCFTCLILFPKIYLQQQIYYKSRDISKLNREYVALKEENRLINASVEAIRFKNQILDTLF